MELYNVSRQEQVWRGRGKNDSRGQIVDMEVYSSKEGYAVRAGDTYRVKSAYNNPTQHDIDAMAGVFIFYSRE